MSAKRSPDRSDTDTDRDGDGDGDGDGEGDRTPVDVSTMEPKHPVVAALFEIELGDRIDVTAQYRDWQTPFVVTELVERREENAFDGGMLWRDIRIAPAKHRLPGSGWKFSVCSLSGPPVIGESFGALTHVEIIEPAPPDELVDLAPWVDGDPEEIVDAAPVARTLGDVLDAVEQYDSLIQISQRLAAPNITRTQQLLDKLGLVRGDQLVDPVELADRVELLREVVDDD